jgi:hypothetical protein
MDYLAESDAVVVLGRLVTSNRLGIEGRQCSIFTMPACALLKESVMSMMAKTNKWNMTNLEATYFTTGDSLRRLNTKSVLESRQQISEVAASIF